MAALTCLGEYSHSNNLAKRMIGLYLYANGAQRQTIAVLSNLGLSESYSNIVSRNVHRHRKASVAIDTLNSDIPTKIEYTGTLTQLSEAMRTKSCEVAATGLFASVYDNINLQMKSAEQIIGRHGAFLTTYEECTHYSIHLSTRFTRKWNMRYNYTTV